jgi:phosphatidate cytidylyltransferase
VGIAASVALMLAAFSFGALLVYDCDDFVLAGIGLLLLFFILCALMFVVEVFRRRDNPILNIATTVMSVVYVALPLSLMSVVPILLNQSEEAWNPWVFLCYLFLVWGNDVFAYLFGISFGRHKMCERLSPKKSWEGFVGGVLGSLAMGAVGAMVTDGSYGLWLGLALVVSLSSVVGDLVESMFKREANIKDSGKIMPGHGGILDRFDALILSAPFAFIYLLMVRMML